MYCISSANERRFPEFSVLLLAESNAIGGNQAYRNNKSRACYHHSELHGYTGSAVKIALTKRNGPTNKRSHQNFKMKIFAYPVGVTPHQNNGHEKQARSIGLGASSGLAGCCTLRRSDRQNRLVETRLRPSKRRNLYTDETAKLSPSSVLRIQVVL